MPAEASDSVGWMKDESKAKEAQSMRPLMLLVKSVFDEALIVGFTQDEALQLAALTLQSVLARAQDEIKQSDRVSN